MLDNNIDLFIGRKFGLNEHLEVVNWCGLRNNYNKKYTVYCHVCAKDEEMFGTGHFKCTKSFLMGGGIPCGCSVSRRFNKRQFLILSKRRCESLGILLKGFVEPWKSTKTYLQLKCKFDNTEWTTTTIMNLLSKGSGCTTCARKIIDKANVKTDDEYIQNFNITGKFVVGTVFSKVDKIKDNCYWHYYCPKCSNDEYVINSLCSGVFISPTQSLQKGYLSCRCSPVYKWTKEQSEYRLNKLFKDDVKYKFVGWAEKYSGNKTKALLSCDIHKVWNCDLQHVLAGGRCSMCAKSGFDKSKTGFIYVLKVSGHKNFTGFGISNIIKKRLRTHKNLLNSHNLIMSDVIIFETTGEIAFKIESQLKRFVNIKDQGLDGFKKEASAIEDYNKITEYITQEIKRMENDLEH